MDLKQLEKDLEEVIENNIDILGTPTKFTNFAKAKESHLVNRINTTLKLIKQQTDLPNTKDPRELLEFIRTLDIKPENKPLTFPHEVRQEMKSDHDEMQKCLENGCYRSAIILCGRILETALHRKHFEATGNDLLEKAPGISLGKIIAKLAESGIVVDPGITNQIHLINQVRIHSVHKQQKVFTPTETQTRAIIMFTMDALKKLF